MATDTAVGCTYGEMQERQLDSCSEDSEDRSWPLYSVSDQNLTRLWRRHCKLYRPT